MNVTKRDGRREPVDFDKVNASAERACEGIPEVSASEIVLDASLQLYEGMPTGDIDKALIMSARTKLEKEPNYSYATARLLLNNIYKEVFGAGVEHDLFEEQYRTAFVDNIEELIDLGRLNPDLSTVFDLEALAAELLIERDLKFKYMGLQTLYDRYFLDDSKGRKLESPQAFFMRVAMGISLREIEPMKTAVRLYEIMSDFRYMPSTPTLFNAGTTHPQLSSCYLSTMHDSEDGIMGTIHDQARLSKYAGGVAVDLGYLRASGSKIRKINGTSDGPIPFAKILNDALLAFNQAGKRKGVGAVYLPVWHKNIRDFIRIRQNSGDERRRCHDLHMAVWVNDNFMRAVAEDAEYYLFCPDECPGLHDAYGPTFESLYSSYVQQAKQGILKNYEVVQAKDLAREICLLAKETGHPWVCFADTANLTYMNINAGVIKNSNLCVEIMRHTIATLYDKGQKSSLGETAVCNLASQNLKEYLIVLPDGNYELDYNKMATDIEYIVRGLDNVIDENFYPTEEAELSNKRHRPIGLGTMGFNDVLNAFSIPYDTDEAVKLSACIQEFIAYHAIKTSVNLAKERGPFLSFEGSRWQKGELHHEVFASIRQLPPLPKNQAVTAAAWEEIRSEIVRHGLRNASILAIAPTATISYIVGCSQSIEPDYAVLHTYSTLSGEFTLLNEWFVKEAKRRRLWCPELVNAVKMANGDISLLTLPDDMKRQFRTPFDMDFYKVIDCCAARAQFVDQAVSFNVYYNKGSIKNHWALYDYLWRSGMKTSYYLRSEGMSKVEKITVRQADTPEACPIDGSCESCQ